MKLKPKFLLILVTVAILVVGFWFIKNQSPGWSAYSPTGVSAPVQIIVKGLAPITINNSSEASCQEFKTKSGLYTEQVLFTGLLTNTSDQWQQLNYRLTVTTSSTVFRDAKLRSFGVQPHQKFPNLAFSDGFAFKYGDNSKPGKTGPGLKNCQLELSAGKF